MLLSKVRVLESGGTKEAVIATRIPLPFLDDIRPAARDLSMMRDIRTSMQTAARIVPWLHQQILGAQTVIFFGEDHSNGADAAVANAVLGDLPLGASPLVVYERGLFQKYRQPRKGGAEVEHVDEPIGQKNDMDRRNGMISTYTIDALREGHDVIYIFCGDQHHGGVRALVLAALPTVTWIHKPSSL